MRAIYLLDSITQITPEMGGAVIVSGSHGGVSSARYVVNAVNQPHAVFFNDAGVGKDDAGIQALQILEPLGILALCYSHDTARIGQAQDGLDSGRISHINNCTRWVLADAVGRSVSEVVARLRERL